MKRTYTEHLESINAKVDVLTETVQSLKRQITESLALPEHLVKEKRHSTLSEEKALQVARSLNINTGMSHQV